MSVLAYCFMCVAVISMIAIALFAWWVLRPYRCTTCGEVLVQDFMESKHHWYLGCVTCGARYSVNKQTGKLHRSEGSGYNSKGL